MFARVDENTLSDHIKLFLKRELSDSAIVLNREVEVGRVAGAPVGNRTDIKIDADRRGDNSDGYDATVTVIETKGCWNPDLLTAIEDRLRNDYVKRLGAPLGIYLIGWFDKEKGTKETIEEVACPSGPDFAGPRAVGIKV
jgi:hypothetical protein